MLKPEEITEIRRSFELIVPRAEIAFTVFYERLFEIAPETRSMFRIDLATQRSKVIATLAHVVQSLDRLDELADGLHDLGGLHARLGVTRDDYGPVGEALIWAMRDALPPHAWSATTEAAWAKAYHILVDIMVPSDLPIAAE